MLYDPATPLTLQWNQLTLNAIKYTKSSPPLAARAMAMVHTAMYDAWSVYNECAISTTTALYIKAPKEQCNKENVRKAFSYAAYRVLTDVFWLALPAENKTIFSDFFCELGYPPEDHSLDINTPQGIGNLAAKMTIECRNGDGSNSLGTLHSPPWSDYTGYKPVNTPDKINDINKWQPQKKTLPSGEIKIQSFLVPHWGLVKPFALKFNWQFRPDAPYNDCDKEFREQAQEVIDISACLTDEQKAIAEYWADGPGTYTPPGHWCEIAHYVLRHEKRNTPCIKLFFALSNALLDASIACWECKYYYDSARPVSVIRALFENEEVQAWAGPCKGTKTIKGKNWQPYIETPAFPEQVSGHSTFSRAAAIVLKNFMGSDKFGACYEVEKGSSKIEPGCNVPCVDIKLEWTTFSDAAEEAGLSRLYGGIHFKRGNELGQKLGLFIGTQAWEKAVFLFNE
jgi:hypothetical protein